MNKVAFEPLIQVVQGKSRHLSERDPNFLTIFKRSYALDFNEDQHDDKPAISQNDKCALVIQQFTIHLVDGRYQVGLLWAQDAINLPNNLSMAV